MNIATGKQAGALSAAIEKAQDERAGFSEMFDAGGKVGTIAIAVANDEEAKAILSAVMTIYDARINALNSALEKL